MTYGSINLRSAPYRGIISEIAAQLGVSRQLVHYHIRTGNPKVISLLEEKIKEREAKFRRNRRILNRLK